MAYKITEECISCGACEVDCKNEAIKAGDPIYVIDPVKCTECVGWYASQKCVEMCPVDCCVPDPAHKETREQLLERWKRQNPGKTPPDLLQQPTAQEKTSMTGRIEISMSQPESAKLEQLRQKLFAELRSLSVPHALNSASIMSNSSPGDSSCTFLEGALAYAMRSDELALERFRACMKLKPLCAEVPYYVGQILTESAIDAYEEAFPGPLTADKALRWAETYDETVTAFACAERVSSTLGLKSIPQHLRQYSILIGVSRFSSVAQTQSEMPPVDDRYTTPDKWLSLIGFQYNEQKVERREALADLVSSLAAEPSVVLVMGSDDILSPLKMILARRGRTRIFEVGPTMTDEMLKVHLSSIKAGSVVLTDSRRIGFGGYFSWAPLGAEALDIVLVNPQQFLSVELLGLLARVGLYARKAPTVRYTLASFVSPA